MMVWPGFGLGWLGMGIGILIMIIFWAGIIALIVWGALRLSRSGGKSVAETPLDTAKKRYANGEITKKEFDQIKKDLGE